MKVKDPSTETFMQAYTASPRSPSCATVVFIVLSEYSNRVLNFRSSYLSVRIGGLAPYITCVYESVYSLSPTGWSLSKYESNRYSPGVFILSYF